MFQMSRNWRSPAALLLLLTATTFVFAAPDDTRQPAAEFDDPVQPLTPARPRSEAEQDRIFSAANFAHGRMLMRREDYSGALARFQRAWRYDPEAVSILAQIVPLAFELERNEEAARYAVIMAEREPKDPVLLRRLALHLTQQRDWPRALRLYEKALKLQQGSEPDAAAIVARMEMGRLYFLTDEYKKSAANFAIVRAALDEPERFAINDTQQQLLLGKAELTYALLAESFFLAGRFDDAAVMFDRANQAKPNKSLLAFRMARIDAERGKMDQALEKLEQYFEAQLSLAGSEPYQLLAEILGKKFQNEERATRELIDRLEKLYEDDPANTALAYYLADQLRSQQQLDRAVELYVDLLQLQPALDAHQGLIDIYRQQQRHDELLSALGAAVDAAGSLEALGQSADDISENPVLVAAMIELAQKRQQSDPPSLGQGQPLAAALLALEAEKFDVADEFFETALAATRAKPDKAQLMMTWGLEMFMAEQADRAARVFQRAIDDKVMPENNSAFYYYLAGALEYDDRTDQAAAAARRAAELDPSSVRFQSREAWIVYHAHRYDEAKELYQGLLDRFDADYRSSEVREVMREARLVFSNICVQQDDLPQAEEWLEQVLDEFPEHIGALNDLGYLWADQNKHLNRALNMVKLAVEGEPDNIAYRDSLGWAYYRLGRFDEAVAELERAVEGENPDGVILDHLGDAYLKDKQPQKAIATWRKAAEQFRTDDDKKMLQATQAKIKQHGQQ